VRQGGGVVGFGFYDNHFNYNSNFLKGAGRMKNFVRMGLLSAVVMLWAGLMSVGYGQGASSLVGIWMPEGGGTAPRGFPDKMELLSDGTCIFEGRSASWKTSGERLFFMNIGGSSGVAYNYLMSNSALVLINDHGQGAKYRKHRPGDGPLPTKEQQEINSIRNNLGAVMQQQEKQAQWYLDNGQYDKAIDAFTQIIRTNPAFGYIGRGSSYFIGKKDYDRAIADYTMALNSDQKDPAGIYALRGGAYSDKGDYDKAIADYNKAIQLAPNEADYYNSRGRAYRQKGDYNKALADFNKAIQLAPNDEDNYNERGYAYLGMRDYNKALADFNKAVQLAPNEANPYDSRGEAYLIMGDYDKAIADYSKALRLDPTMESAKEGLAKARMKKQGR
jgi:tetratricopeptide (TPR) repeat protein